MPQACLVKLPCLPAKLLMGQQKVCTASRLGWQCACDLACLIQPASQS